MAETINMTNLNDLPSNPTMGGNIQMHIQSQSPDNLNKSSPVSLDQTTISQIVSGLQQATLSGATRLPNRDIPMTSEHLSADNQAMPNYVPNTSSKYINEDDEYDENSRQNNNFNDIYSEIQFPLLLGILYFIFQMPIFKNTLFQYLTFLFSSDGNYNMNGLAFVSIIFSLTYYVFTNVIFKVK
jgi:hypothetical protein